MVRFFFEANRSGIATILIPAIRLVKKNETAVRATT